MSIISVRNLTFCYEGSFDNIFENVNFTIDTDWRLGFIGRNGRGKTTFLRLLTGDYAYEGSITASVHFDYFPFAVTNESLTAAEILLTVSGIAEYDFWRAERELGLLGVDEENLIREYLLSFNSVAGHDGTPSYVMVQNAQNFIDGLKTYGTEGATLSEHTEAFLLHIGVTEQDIQSIKNILLEE